MSIVWDMVRAAYLGTSGASVEDVSETLSLLSDHRPVRVLLAQTRQPFADKNGRDGAAPAVRKDTIDNTEVVTLRQELAESRNTIAQLRRNQEPSKRQQRDGLGWNRPGWQEQKTQEQPPPRRNVTVPEGQRQALKRPASPPPPKARANMLRTSRETSHSDEEPSR
jgi:hypothetical protein